MIFLKVIIETTNSSQPITVKNLKYISVVDEDDNAEIIKDNFEAFLLLDELQYTFVGDSFLHVLGDRIEYVQFCSDF